MTAVNFFHNKGGEFSFSGQLPIIEALCFAW